MIKRLHTRVKIFFPNPYVVRLDHDDTAGDQQPVSFMKLTSRVRNLIQGTWGFSRPEYEMVKVKNDFNNPAPPGPNHFNSMAQGQVIASLFDPDYKNVCRSYWCFQDEMDALQFRLMLDGKAMQVHMWPERLFTIHEVVEVDEQ